MNLDRAPEEVVRELRPDLDPKGGATQAHSFNSLLRLVTVVQECNALRKQGIRGADRVMAERYGVSRATVRGWLYQAKLRGIEHLPAPTRDSLSDEFKDCLREVILKAMRTSRVICPDDGTVPFFKEDEYCVWTSPGLTVDTIIAHIEPLVSPRRNGDDS